MLNSQEAMTPGFSVIRKPFYPVEIDYKNPLSAGLFFANIPQPGGRATLDLVSKRTADTISTLSRCVGEWYQQDELNTLAPTLWDIAWPYADLGVSDDASYTMYWRIRIPDSSATTAASIFQWGTSEIEIKRQTTSLQIIWGGTTRHTISGVSHGDIYDIVMTRNQVSNVVTYYINGVNSGTTTGISYTTFNLCDQIRYHNEADQRGEGFALFYVWVDRELTQPEVTALIRAPYQIVKPIRPQVFFTASGASGSTYEEAATFANALSVVLSSAAIIESSNSLSCTASVNQSAALTIESALTIAANASESSAADITMESGSTFPCTAAVNQSALLTIESALTVGATLAALNTVLGAYEDALTFDVVSILQSSPGNIFNDSVSLGSVASVAVSGGLALSATTAFAIDAALNNNASATIEAGTTFSSTAALLQSALADYLDAVTLSATADLVEAVQQQLEDSLSLGARADITATGGLEFDSGLTISAQAQLTSSSEIGVAVTLTTPTKRTLVIQATNRKLTIQ